MASLNISTNITYRAWEEFVRHTKINPIVRPEIAQSWKRSYKAGVDPFGTATHLILDQSGLNKKLAQKKELIEVAQPFITKTYQFVAGTGFIVLLSDENGYILEILGDKDVLEYASHFNLIQGACWLEDEAGTNGLGTALAVKKPVQISGAEHYCRAIHNWTCSAAPIFDCMGRVIGALQMSGSSSKAHRHTLGMVVSSVEAIEGHLRIRRRNHELTLLNNHLNNIFLSVSDGVIVVNQHGLITQKNPVVEKIISMDNTRENYIGDYIEKEAPIKEMLSAGKSFTDADVIVKSKSGPLYCLSTGKPIRDEKGNITEGVIFIKPLKNIKSIVNRYTGAHATFSFKDIIGQNKKLFKAVELAKMAAGNDGNVLLQGESGTGKEVFAQSIHNQSAYRNGPFIAVNCGAIPRDLIASELFGYEEGAFTGAQRGGRPGKFELASGGTLFLDEIGEMPLEQQVALLRVLQDKQVIRLGSDKVLSIDVRIICASNKNLKQEVQKGNFREDLYYRLNVISICLPALRERRDDLPLLFNAFYQKFCRKLGVTPKPMEPRVMEYFKQYSWPGNIREFQNVVERMVYMAGGQAIGLDHLPKEILTSYDSGSGGTTVSPYSNSIGAERMKIKKLLAEKEREEIFFLLRKNSGNMSQVARDLGISRSSLYRKLKKLRIK